MDPVGWYFNVVVCSRRFRAITASYHGILVLEELHLPQDTAVTFQVGISDDEKVGFSHGFSVTASPEEVGWGWLCYRRGEELMVFSALGVRLAGEVSAAFRRLIPSLHGTAPAAAGPPDLSKVGLPLQKPGGNRLLIGPANSAGQGYLWAQAVNALPGWQAENITYHREECYGFPSDHSGRERDVVYNPGWGRQFERVVEESFSAVLVESLLPLFGTIHFRNVEKEIAKLVQRGKRVGVILHGSDIRDPQTQMSRVRGSVFQEMPHSQRQRLSMTAKRNLAVLRKLEVPIFVSTPDLLDHVPAASWLPVLLGEQFHQIPNVKSVPTPAIPTVMHLPSRGSVKGTRWIHPQMLALQEEGLIDYLAPERVPHSQMRKALEQADIVIDSVGLGPYGVTAVEAMALGKVVVGQLSPRVRSHIKDETGLEVPIVQADRYNLAKVVADLAAKPRRREELREEGQQYVQKVHSGRQVRRVLSPFLLNVPSPRGTPPNALVVSRIFWPEPAAASQRLRAAAQGMVRAGSRVRVLTTQADSGHEDPGVLNISRWPVLRNPEGYVRGYWQYLSFDVPLLLRLLLERKVDVALVEPPPTTGVVARLVLGSKRVPYVWYAADIWSDATRAMGAPSSVSAVVQLAEKFALRGAVAVVAVSEGVAQRAKELGANEVVVIPGGIDTEIYTPSAGRGNSDQLDQIGITGPYFIYAGTASEWQGADIFISAFEELARTHPDTSASLQLLFVGHGSQWQALRTQGQAVNRRLGRQAVLVLDQMAPQEVAPLLAGAEAALVSIVPGKGYDYAYPTKVLAALSTGTEVIFVGTGPAAQDVEEHSLGLVSPYDPKRVAEQLALVVSGQKEKEADRLRGWAVKHRSLRTMGEQVARVVLQHRKGKK